MPMTTKAASRNETKPEKAIRRFDVFAEYNRLDALKDGRPADQAKGHAKEAAGDLTGDQDLENEGKADRAGGEVKEKVGQAKEKVEGLVDKVKDKLTDR